MVTSPGRGLRQVQPSFFSVRAAHDHVEGPEQLADPGVDPAQLLRGDQLAGDPTLVGDHTDPQTRRSRQPQGVDDAGQRLDPGGVMVVGDVDDERAVAVTEKRLWAS